jgi:diguanylate cyclase (GGDEF)-like protein
MVLTMSNKRHTDFEMSKQFITGSTSQQQSRIIRVSLVTVFTSAFFGILLLFTAISAVIAFRLSDFQSILSQLSGNVLPKVTLSGEAFSKVNQLTYLTARLSTSPSQASRLIAFKNIKEKIKEIADLKIITNDDQLLKTQLAAIVNEFDGLNLLIEERIRHQNGLKSQEKKMYQLNAEVMEKSIRAVQHNNNEQFFSWIMEFAKTVSLANQSLAVTRLNQVRRINKQIKQSIENLRTQNIILKLEKNALFAEYVIRLETLLILEDGLLPTRTLELRSSGRSTGRSNFVHNLVEDFARQVQFQSYQLNEAIITEAKSTTQRITTEADLIKLMTFITFFFLAGVAYFLHRKIITRLVNLNSRVLSKIEGKSLDLDVKGNDEISDIANSFNLLINEIEDQKYKHEELSLTDGLTGIANRRSLDKRLAKQLDYAIKKSQSLSVLMMDVDYFKLFNDHYGHLAGDDCLKKIANTFKGLIKRKEDFIARFGGEEFVLILPNTSAQGAEIKAQKVLDAISSLKVTHEWNSASPYVTLSIGCATLSPTESIGDSELLKRADEALFKAKRKGKNCFVTFDIE